MMASNSRFPLLCFIAFWSLCSLHSLLRRAGGSSDSTERKRLLDDVGGLREPDDVKESLREHDNVEGGLYKRDDVEGGPREPGDVEAGIWEDKADEASRTPKRRALLVGISYSYRHNRWSRLDGPYDDVDRFHHLLLNTYEYSPEDIIILKDVPDLSDLFQPTRVNMLHELTRLVAGAAPGDRFTFFYSGHSDQQIAHQDMEEEDGLDEMLIASDERPIIDNELRKILVPLPVGCSLLAIIDACHSGTMLDLPHHHCNSVYVPWQSKGERRTMTMHNNNVRRQATDFTNTTFGVSLSIASTRITDGQQPADQPLDGPSQIDTQLDERGRSQGRRLFESGIRFASPESVFRCDGWCKYSDVQYPSILSLSSCSDLQRSWEGPKGSLTAILCNYLKNDSNPSYRALMTHINFQMHDNALALHDYTRDQKKKARDGRGHGFDGELDTFQQPQLSSLVRLNMDDILCL